MTRSARKLHNAPGHPYHGCTMRLHRCAPPVLRARAPCGSPSPCSRQCEHLPRHFERKPALSGAEWVEKPLFVGMRESALALIGALPRHFSNAFEPVERSLYGAPGARVGPGVRGGQGFPKRSRKRFLDKLEMTKKRPGIATKKPGIAGERARQVLTRNDEGEAPIDKRSAKWR